MAKDSKAVAALHVYSSASFDIDTQIHPNLTVLNETNDHTEQVGHSHLQGNEIRHWFVFSVLGQLQIEWNEFESTVEGQKCNTGVRHWPGYRLVRVFNSVSRYRVWLQDIHCRRCVPWSGREDDQRLTWLERLTWRISLSNLTWLRLDLNFTSVTRDLTCPSLPPMHISA